MLDPWPQAPSMSYEDAMLSHDECSHATWFANDCFALFAEVEAACFHEAGHAVVGYALGFGLPRIEIEAVNNSYAAGVAIGGRVVAAKKSTGLLISRIKDGDIRSAIAHGVLRCAGPAAELRYRAAGKETPRPRLAAYDDHQAVDEVAKVLEANFNLSRFAFRRLVWRQAQKIISDDRIGSAVGLITDALCGQELYWPEGPTGRVSIMMPGAAARALLRTSDLKAGMLSSAWK